VTDTEKQASEANSSAEAETPAAEPADAGSTTPPATEGTPAAGAAEAVEDAAAAVGAGAAVEPQAEARPAGPAPAEGIFWGTGRRKSAVARVRLVPGEGTVKVNQRDVETYFREPQEQAAVSEPLIATNTARHWNVFVNVHGGGHSGQAGAIRLGLARALVKADSRHEAALRDAGYLTRDSRRVERKKYGQRKARRRFQFSKR
jgi:small subunit ribosomal protein S9